MTLSVVGDTTLEPPETFFVNLSNPEGAAILDGQGQVTIANDGLEALEVVHTFQPDVAVIDIGLPGMDGFELATRLRDALGSHHVRLVAVTGYGQASDRERSEVAGIHKHLVKPVGIRELLAAMADDGS